VEGKRQEQDTALAGAKEREEEGRRKNPSRASEPPQKPK
jgi:hypothetical protein